EKEICGAAIRPVKRDISVTRAITVQLLLGCSLPPISASFEPSKMTVLGSRSGASLADVMVMPMTTVAPIEGVTTNPEGLASLAESRFKYFAWVLSMALATPSEPGLLDEEAMTESPGCVTSGCEDVVRITTAAGKMARSLWVLVRALCVDIEVGRYDL